MTPIRHGACSWQGNNEVPSRLLSLLSPAERAHKASCQPQCTGCCRGGMVKASLEPAKKRQSGGPSGGRRTRTAANDLGMSYANGLLRLTAAARTTFTPATFTRATCLDHSLVIIGHGDGQTALRGLPAGYQVWEDSSSSPSEIAVTGADVCAPLLRKRTQGRGNKRKRGLWALDEQPGA